MVAKAACGALLLAVVTSAGCKEKSTDRPRRSSSDIPPAGQERGGEYKNAPLFGSGAVFYEGAASLGSTDSAEITPEAAGRDDSESGVSEADGRTIARLSSAQVKAVTPLSPRTLSVLLRLEGSRRAVFKPAVRGDKRPRREVAAFRISRWLGMENVPAATMRRLSFEFLIARLEGEDEQFEARLKKRRPNTPDGQIEGAMIEWLPGLDPSGYGALGGKSGLLELVGRDAPPHPLAEEVCAMLVFDYLIGNWDRFSGGNVFVSEDGARLLLIDHNASFEPWSDRQRARMEELLEALEKVPGVIPERLERLDTGTLLRIVTENAERGPLLTPQEIALTLARKRAILEQIKKVYKAKETQSDK